MDLAIGARQTFVMMTLLTRDGRPKLVPECTYPLTGLACVSRVYTDLPCFSSSRRASSSATCSGPASPELSNSPRRSARGWDAGGGLMTRTSRTTRSASSVAGPPG